MKPPKTYAFDVDDTLYLMGSPRPGPVDVQDLKHLMDEGNIVGLCGNHRIAFRYWPEWYKVVSFFGGHPPLEGYKPKFLNEIKQSIWLGNPQIVDYVLVGNARGEALAGIATPTANDDGAARLAGWRFISAHDFSLSAR